MFVLGEGVCRVAPTGVTALATPDRHLHLGIGGPRGDQGQQTPLDRREGDLPWEKDQRELVSVGEWNQRGQEFAGVDFGWRAKHDTRRRRRDEECEEFANPCWRVSAPVVRTRSPGRTNDSAGACMMSTQRTSRVSPRCPAITELWSSGGTVKAVATLNDES